MMLSISPENYDSFMAEIINKVSRTTPQRLESIASTYKSIKTLYLNQPDFADGTPYLTSILRATYLMAFNMDGSYFDVCECLLAPAYIHKLIDSNKARVINKEVYEHAKKFLTPVARERSEKKLTREEIDLLIYDRLYDIAANKLFEKIKDEITKNRIPQAYIINEAYNIAKVAHERTYRKSGEPYIFHPLRVAEILAKMGVESTIIAAALLHDVLEDSDFTFDDLAKRTSLTVAQLVDAVTSIEEEYKKQIKKNPANAEPLLNKNNMDEETVKKMIRYLSRDDSMIFALYIKAADRIHNLQTMDSISPSAREKKVAETKKYYLPIFKKYKLNTFVPIIEDLCWKLSAPEQYNVVHSTYRNLLQKNKESTDDTFELLRKTLENIPEDYYRHFGFDHFIVELNRQEYTPYALLDMLRIKSQSFDEVKKLIAKDGMTLFDINIVFYNRAFEHDLSSFVEVFMTLYRDIISLNDITITDFATEKKDNHGDTIFSLTIEDKFCCTLKLNFFMSHTYHTVMHGVYGGFASVDNITEDIDNLPLEMINTETILVKKKNGQNMILPKGATVLDFAFEIHEELGLSAKGAKINNQDKSIFEELEHGNEVIIIADSGRGDSESKKMIPHARIDWLNHVVTTKAKKKLTRYLQGKYEGKGHNTST